MFDVVFLDAEKEQYEPLFELARAKLEPGAVVIVDNVLSHVDALGAYSRARQADPTLESVTVPLDRGLEISVSALSTVCPAAPLRSWNESTAERRCSDLKDSSTGSGGTSG